MLRADINNGTMIYTFGDITITDYNNDQYVELRVREQGEEKLNYLLLKPQEGLNMFTFDIPFLLKYKSVYYREDHIEGCLQSYTTAYLP
jgi:hypothetical protein